MQDIMFYEVFDDIKDEIVIRPGRVQRKWMNDTSESYAYRCLPLNIANQNGYEIAAKREIRIRWNGGNLIQDIDVISNSYICQSHFGFGIITMYIGHLIRTPKDVNLYVSGPPNSPKKYISPLSGIVETDWNPASFTMNWQMLQPNVEIVFERDEPFCFIFPIQRKYVEQFQPVFAHISSNDEEHKAHTLWSDQRAKFIRKLMRNETTEGWQKTYFQGLYSDGTKCPVEHQTKIKLNEPKEQNHD